MKISAADLATFNAVCAHNGLDADEIELAKSAYRNDPEAARTLYNALAREIPAPPDARGPRPAPQWVKLSPPPFKLEKS